MALNLQLGYQQSNDAVRIRFTDSTGEYNVSTNTTGWGSPNEAVADIVYSADSTVGKYHLYLSVKVTTSDNIQTVYDDIDLYSNFTTEFSKTSGMVFDITPNLLVDSGTPMGLVSDQLSDGVYEVSYILKTADTESAISTSVYTFFVDGIVRQAIYSKAAYIPTVYNCKVLNADEADWREIVEVLGIYSILQGMLSNPSIEDSSDKLSILGVLEKLLEL